MYKEREGEGEERERERARERERVKGSDREMHKENEREIERERERQREISEPYCSLSLLSCRYGSYLENCGHGAIAEHKANICEPVKTRIK